MITATLVGVILSTAPTANPPAGFCKCKVPARTFAKKVIKAPIVQTKGAPKAAMVYSTPPAVNHRPSFGIGGRAAVGGTTCAPYVFTQVGLRARFFPAHLGLDLSTQFAYGFGASLLGYPIQGERFSWHLNAGVLAGGARTFSAGSVPRAVDLALGTGIEYRLPVKWLSITGDYRITTPFVNTPTVWGNSAIRSQLMVGLIAHTW